MGDASFRGPLTGTRNLVPVRTARHFAMCLAFVTNLRT